MFIVCISL